MDHRGFVIVNVIFWAGRLENWIIEVSIRNLRTMDESWPFFHALSWKIMPWWWLVAVCVAPSSHVDALSAATSAQNELPKAPPPRPPKTKRDLHRVLKNALPQYF